MKTYYVYIVTNKKNGTLYIGVTSNIARRIYEHKQKITQGFTSRYNLDRLVYIESTEDVHAAITREKNMKAWKREWKIKLIQEMNPNWDDLYETIN